MGGFPCALDVPIYIRVLEHHHLIIYDWSVRSACKVALESGRGPTRPAQNRQPCMSIPHDLFDFVVVGLRKTFVAESRCMYLVDFVTTDELGESIVPAAIRLPDRRRFI